MKLPQRSSRFGGDFVAMWTDIKHKYSLQKKDTSKFDMALKQSLDTIQSRAAWVQVSSYVDDCYTRI